MRLKDSTARKIAFSLMAEQMESAEITISENLKLDGYTEKQQEAIMECVSIYNKNFLEKLDYYAAFPHRFIMTSEARKKYRAILDDPNNPNKKFKI